MNKINKKEEKELENLKIISEKILLLEKDIDKTAKYILNGYFSDMEVKRNMSVYLAYLINKMKFLEVSRSVEHTLKKM